MTAPLLFEKQHTFTFDDRWQWLVTSSVEVTIYKDGAWEIWIACVDGGRHCLCEHERDPERSAREVERILRCASAAAVGA